MTIQAIRTFIDQRATAVASLAALGAALDALANGTQLEPVVAQRLTEFLAACDGGDLLANVTAQEARPLAGEIRYNLALDAKLATGRSTTGWNHDERDILQGVGDFARNHAVMLTRGVIPNLPGLAERFAAPGAAFLDIGVGVAGTTLQMAELWPTLRIVGIDVLQAALSLARENVARSQYGDRIELREQGAEHITDDQAFDLAWVPQVFIPAHAIEMACPRVRRALKPGGWAIHVFINPAALADPQAVALWRLRSALWGGPSVTAAAVETMLRDNGFVDVQPLPGPPGGLICLAAGRRPL